MSDWRWRDGNDIRLLENGDEYYRRVFEVIAAARREVRIETFILFEDGVGEQFEQAVTAAAGNGARVEILVDGYGSANLSAGFIARMQKAGIVLRMFEPSAKVFGSRVNLFKRMHRKIVVVDDTIGFIGGMNFSDVHLMSYGPEAQQDYAIEVQGPLVADLKELTLAAVPKSQRPKSWWRREQPMDAPPAGDVKPMRALVASRDNYRHRNDIERLYLIAIRAARTRIVIANAYFFPGYRLLRALRGAAQRGVQVDLILQGNPDMPVARFITQTLYSHLARAGVAIHEYCERPIHAKVAAIDGEWATVGSSNLDPLSLSLNLEANVFVADSGFAGVLTDKLDALIAHSCKKLDLDRLSNPSALGLVLGFIAYHVSRHFPRVAGWLPSRRPAHELLTAQRKIAAPAEPRA